MAGQFRAWLTLGTLAALAATVGGLPGCDSKPKPKPIEYTLASPYIGMRTFAVAPAINQSGFLQLDTLSVSDRMFEELQQVQGLNVLPVNKTLAAMQRLGMRTIDSPQSAQRLAAAMGADAIVVEAVTSYDPYSPPVMGMVVQLYTARTLEAPNEPQARTLNGTPLPEAGPVGGADNPTQQPVAHVAAVFNASNQTVLLELRDFARGRTNYESALQEERFLADSDAYTRFVCHAMVRRLMEVERTRLNGR